MTRKQSISERIGQPDSPQQEIRILETGHVPFNKRSWEVHECRAIVRVVDYDGSKPGAPAWTNITLTELESYESGREIERNISVDLNAETRGAVLTMLDRGRSAALEGIVREMIYGDGTDACLQRVIDLCNAARERFSIERESAWAPGEAEAIVGALEPGIKALAAAAWAKHPNNPANKEGR